MSVPVFPVVLGADNFENLEEFDEQDFEQQVGKQGK
jgi:hypothetical protein